MRKTVRVLLLPAFLLPALVANLVYAAEPITALPAAVRAVIQREFPAASITEIEDGDFEGMDGTLYQKDEKVSFNDLPPAVLAVIKKELSGAEPDNLKRLTEHGKVFYELEGEVSGKDIELKIDTEGKILEKEVEGGDDDDGEAVGLPPVDPIAEPGSDALPLQYLGPDLPDREAPDGRLMYSPGVQNIQIARANRRYPPPFPEGTENEKGWTYQHHVGMEGQALRHLGHDARWRG